jgi:HK97 family phage portal protein
MMPSLLSRLFGADAPPPAEPPSQKSSQKSSRAGALLEMHSLGALRWTPRNYVALTQAGYDRNAIVYRAVRMIAEGAASIPWRLYERGIEIETHPMLDLATRPNPVETGTGLVESLVSNLLLFGNAYVEASRVDGVPRELYALRPDRMSVVAGRNGWPSAYDYTVAGQTIRYQTGGEGISPILHLKLYNPLDDHYGLPPLAAAQVALDTHNAAAFWNKALLDNSARPSGALVYAGPEGAHLTDTQFDRLRTELEENFIGAANAGRPLLLEGGLDWKALSLTPKDMDFIEAKAAAARDIALAFGVPPLVLGLPGDNTRTNYAEANLAFWRQTVIPTIARIQKSVTAWLAPAFGRDLVFDYDVDRIDALSADRAAEWKRVSEATFLTDDEKRAAVGYGPKGKEATRKAVLERRYSPDQLRDDRGGGLAAVE